MIKAFLRDTSIYAISSLISRIISFFLVPLYTRILSPSAYGSLDLLFVFANLVNLTVALEISQGEARYYMDASNQNKKVIYASSALWFTTICYSGFLLISICWRSELSRIVMGADGLESSFTVGVVYIFFNGLLYFLQNQMRWDLCSKSYAISTLLVTLIGSFFSVSFSDQFGLSGILFGMLIGVLIGCFYSLYNLRDTLKLYFNITYIKEMLTFSIPLVPSSIAVFISLYVDRLIINNYLSPSEVGIYGIGFRIASISTLAMVGIQGALTPLIFNNYRAKETPKNIAIIFRIFVGLSLFLFVAITVFSHEILTVITTPDYYSAEQVIGYLIPTILFSQMYVFSPGIHIDKKTYILLLVNILGAILHTLLNLLLIPSLGIRGASIAGLIGYACVFAVNMSFSQRFYYVPHNWYKIVLACIFSLFFIFMGSYVFDSWVGKIFSILLTVFIVIKTGLIEKNEIIKVRNELFAYSKNSL